MRAILLFLERNGVDTSADREIVEDTKYQGELIGVMERAREDFEHLFPELCSSANFDLEAVLSLFGGAWEALVEHSTYCHEWAYKNHKKYELKAWEEAIVQKGLSGKEQLARQKRQLAEYNPVEVSFWKRKTNEMTRFKIDSEKGAVLMAEWSRYMRVQKRCHDHRARN